jgi:RND family efflux transporter MFP subunit
MKLHRSAIAAAVVAAAAVALSLVLAPSPAAKPEAQAVPVRVAVAASAARAGEIRATGTLVFKREMTLSFKVAGIVKTFHAESGDTVKAGAVLAQLNPTDVGARDREAQATLDNANAALRRAKELQAKGFASQARVDDAMMAVTRARAASDASAFDAAKADLRAPTDGVVLARLAEPNEVVSPGKPILTFGDASGGLVLIVPVSDSQITRLREGDAATITFSGLKPAFSTVTRLAGKADARTGAFDVELKLAEAPPGLRSGLVGEARIVPAIKDQASTYLAIPALALLEGRGDTAGVFIVDAQGKAQRRSIRVAGFLDDLVLVAEGLKPGEKVVTSGAPYLRNGQIVTIVADPQS